MMLLARDNLHGMGGWRNPSRAERIVIYQEGGELCQYWRGDEQGGEAVWRREPETGGMGEAHEAMTTKELLRVIEVSLGERRRATRGRKFRL
jgi:hypothetical protein